MKNAAAWYTPTPSKPLNRRAYCPFSLLLFVGAIVISADADWVESACAVALTITVEGVGTVGGAIYKPPELTVPHDDPLQPAPVTVQVTPVFVVPVTTA